MEEKFIIPRPRDPETGRILPIGPIRLEPVQKRILREALRRDSLNKLIYNTVIYSAPKKSGKSAVTAGVGMYMADNVPHGAVYLMANDGKQADERLSGPIMKCIELAQSHGGYFADKTVRKRDRYAKFINGSVIQAITVDAAGEAGAEPVAVLFSELWGYDTPAKKKLYTEMTLPPTLHGYAIRWIETYAGYEGVSDLLWNLYVKGVIEAEPHPDFMDLVDDRGEPVVWVNEKARLFTYWDHIPRMSWQQEEGYYDEERELLADEQEFKRLHQNRWISPTSGFIVTEWWEACYDHTLEPLTEGSKTPAIVAVDAATDNDCVALVLITRDPKNPKHGVAVRAVRIFDPAVWGEIDLDLTVGKTLREWCKKWNIICCVYDKFQMATLVSNYQTGKISVTVDEIGGMTEEQIQSYIASEARAVKIWYENFSQQDLRALADKKLRDMIQSRLVAWKDFPEYDIKADDNRETLFKHVVGAGMKRQGSKIRIEKMADHVHNDAAVALSMATYQTMLLDIKTTSQEDDMRELLKRVQRGELSYSEFQEIASAKMGRIDDRS